MLNSCKKVRLYFNFLTNPLCFLLHDVSGEIHLPTLTKFVGFKLAKFLVPIFKSLTINDFAAKDSFYFAEELVDQQLDFFMGNLGVDSLLTNISLEDTKKFTQMNFSINLKSLKAYAI